MFKRPFTAIYQTVSGITEAKVIDVPCGKEAAAAYANDILPGVHVVAMIPGVHADNTYTYDAPGSFINMPRPTKPAIDPGGPWPENLPPGF